MNQMTVFLFELFFNSCPLNRLEAVVFFVLSSLSLCESLPNVIFNNDSRFPRSFAGLFSVTELVIAVGKCRLCRDGRLPM